jgi:hypothetical protein
VDREKYGDRLDHLSAIGRVRRRVQIMSQIQDKPFILLLNLQIPGDPPVSIVFYFIIPPDFYNTGEIYILTILFTVFTASTAFISLIHAPNTYNTHYTSLIPL